MRSVRRLIPKGEICDDCYAVMHCCLCLRPFFIPIPELELGLELQAGFMRKENECECRDVEGRWDSVLT